MTLYSHALRQHQITKIGRIFQLIDADPDMRKRAVIGIEDYLDSFDRRSDFPYAKQNRLMKGTMPRDASMCALLYDYLVLEFLSVLNNALSKNREEREDIIAEIEELRREVNEQINGLDNPFAAMARDIDADDLDRKVPDLFIQRFIGYRRSSHGEIVRFYLRILRSKNREQAMVRYVNQYWRGTSRWFIKGGGFYAPNNVLYLFGHARDQTDKSTGYRTMALRQLGSTSMVCGPLISMDEVEPIAARAVLIPWKKHKFTEAQEKMSFDQLLEHVIKTKRREVHSDEYDAYIDEIRQNVSNCFPVRKDQGLFHYISNMTTDVLHCVPNDDDALIIEELRYRLIAQNSRHWIKPEVAKAMRIYLDGMNRM